MQPGQPTAMYRTIHPSINRRTRPHHKDSQVRQIPVWCLPGQPAYYHHEAGAAPGLLPGVPSVTGGPGRDYASSTRDG